MAIVFYINIKNKLYWRNVMKAWTTPTMIERSVGMEINCYACAEIV